MDTFDPLGELCLAAEKDAGRPNAIVNILSGGQETIRQPDSGDELPATEPGPEEHLTQLYQQQCTSHDCEPHSQHVNLLKSIPESLIVLNPLRRDIRGHLGGAAISLPEGHKCSHSQQMALLTTISPPETSDVVVLVDSIDFSDIELSHVALEMLVRNATQWGPWWRLRSLTLRNCGLQLPHIRAICSIDAIPCFWNLQYLDISSNKGIGRKLTDDGSIRGASDFAVPSILLFLNLWRNSPLKRLNLEDTDIKSDVMNGMLRMLVEYDLKTGTQECGYSLHGGTRSTLEMLSLGPPPVEEGIWSDSFFNILNHTVANLPNIAYIKIVGMNKDQQKSIADHCNSSKNGGYVEIDASIVAKKEFDVLSLSVPIHHQILTMNDDHDRLESADDLLGNLPLQILDDFGLGEPIQRATIEQHKKTDLGNNIFPPVLGEDGYEISLRERRKYGETGGLANVPGRKPHKDKAHRSKARSQGKTNNKKMSPRRRVEGTAIGMGEEPLYKGGDNLDDVVENGIDLVSESTIGTYRSKLPECES